MNLGKNIDNEFIPKFGFRLKFRCSSFGCHLTARKALKNNYPCLYAS